MRNERALFTAFVRESSARRCINDWSGNYPPSLSPLLPLPFFFLPSLPFLFTVNERMAGGGGGEGRRTLCVCMCVCVVRQREAADKRQREAVDILNAVSQILQISSLT